MIETVPFAQLDPALVDQAYADVLTRVQEDNPKLDLRKKGPFAGILLRYNALLGAQRQTNIEAYQQASSLLQISENPALADPDLVDAVLSNFRVVRKQGAQAVGEVTVVVSDNITVTIAQGSTWTAGATQFFAPQVYTAKAEAGQVNDVGDRVYTPTADGNWAFTIQLTATDAGTVAVPKDTLVIPDILPDNYVNSFAAADFSGGSDTETNQQLIDRFETGIAAQALSNRVNMKAMLQAVPAFANIVDQSVIGMGDAEMSRDRHTIFPISMGGRVDWYVRTVEAIFRQKITKTCSLVEINPDASGLWQTTLDRDEAAGLYEIANVRPGGDISDVGGFTITETTRTLDITGSDFAPDLQTEAEAAYSRWHTVTVQFIDSIKDHGSLSIGATDLYDLEARGLPLIADIQDYVGDRQVRAFGHDCLVRAPVPCIVELSLTIHKRSGQPDPDTAAIAAALAVSVNRVGFVGRLFSSQLQNVVSGFLTTDQRVAAIDMFSRILVPGGDVRYVHDQEVLNVPNDPANFVTYRTVQFFLDPQDVAITVAVSVPDSQ